MPPRGPFPPLASAQRARSLRETLAARPERGPLWVFAYGSLMWRPCFTPVATRVGEVRGYARAFSMWTVSARGSPAAPGLGLALEARAGGCCEGLLLEIGEDSLVPDLERVWVREMLTGIYRPAWLEAHAAGEAVTVLAFVADPTHPQYADGLSLDEQARYIATAAGELGSCHEYLASTVAALRAHGIRDRGLERLLTAVRRVRTYNNGPT